jgi:hypothetical protein
MFRSSRYGYYPPSLTFSQTMVNPYVYNQIIITQEPLKDPNPKPFTAYRCSDSIGLSAAVVVVVARLAGLLSTETSSCVTGTSTVFVSVTGVFVIVASFATTRLNYYLRNSKIGVTFIELEFS